MTDRPIIFSGPMVCALLDGRKTQTRRLATSPLRKCEIGDRLYVRESFIESHGVGGYAADVDPDKDPDGETIDVIYRADDGWNERSAGPWTPSIHMPRRLSRLTLIVEAVRVEPLQAISEDDARAEGIEHSEGRGDVSPGWRNYHDPSFRYSLPTGRSSFKTLWDSLHDKPGERWEDNPEVVALTFRVERGNIDRIPA